MIKKLNYSFNSTDLFVQALTHRSAAKVHNERLEFLGDAVLGMVIAESLYQKFPQLPEGKLTRLRSDLVKGQTLADIARELDLGHLLKLGPGERKSGGQRRDSILADAVEAIIGAIYLDSSFDQVSSVIFHLYQSRIDNLDPNVLVKDNKTRLQEKLQSQQMALPDYEVIDIAGKDHAQTFTVSCYVKSLNITSTGSGRSRRIAEQEAAKALLEKILK